VLDVGARYRDGEPLIGVILHGQVLLVVFASSFPAFAALLFSRADRRIVGTFGVLGGFTLFLVGGTYALLASDPTPSKSFAIVSSTVYFVLAVPIAAISIAAARQ
jgi:hypothetical protein